MTMNQTAVVVGAGHAGSQCAVSLRQEGFEGNIILLDGESLGLPYHKPPLSKSYINSKDAEAKPLRPESAYVKADIKRQQGFVRGIDRAQKTVTLDGGEEIAYDTLFIATGATNRELASLKGINNVHSIRTLADATRLRDQLPNADAITILGGGFIGLETAACLASMGKSVTVIEGAERVLSRVCSASISQHVQAELRCIGIELLTEQTANGFSIENNRVNSIKLREDTSIDCDLLLVGIGAVPNIQLAEQAGLLCDEGILVSANLRTSDPSIFAIGDCARYPHWQSGQDERLESVQNAVDQAKFVAASIAKDKSATYKTVPWFWSDIGPLKLQIAGLRLNDCQVVERTTDDTLAVYHLKNNRVACVESINSAQDHLVARKLIGSDIEVSAEDIAKGPAYLKSLLN